MTLTDRRRFYAEEIAAISNVTNPAIVEALASVPREQFLPRGPWTIRGEADFQSPSGRTVDADPRHVYHNLAIAIDPARHLFNGAPGLLALAIDRLWPKRGDRALHVGAGTGYYTAIIAHCVGREGRVVAVETDHERATLAHTNLRSLPWVDVQRGDGRTLSGSFDSVLINAGVTHPLEAWLEALAPARFRCPRCDVRRYLFGGGPPGRRAGGATRPFDEGEPAARIDTPSARAARTRGHLLGAWEWLVSLDWVKEFPRDPPLSDTLPASYRRSRRIWAASRSA